jgi:SP family xylose:H+ symportor-like MFS transporter
VVAVLSVDRFGRKPLQIIGALVMAVSMIALGADFWLGGKGMVALVAMLVYTAGFAVSWGPVTWVLLSEIFPNQIRGKAMAVAVAAQWIANYLVSWTFPILDENPYLVEHFKHGFAYWIYGVMSILAALFVWRFVPETKGRSLEQMQTSNEENQEAAGHKTLTMAARNSQVSSGHRQSVVERVTGTGQPRTGTE